jgi:D-sedoheptulose 7-phosphate isomerase
MFAHGKQIARLREWRARLMRHILWPSSSCVSPRTASAQPAICLASDGGLLTAAGNDYGFSEIFARQVAALGQSGDVLICLTTSGQSKNVVRALEEAKAHKLKTIALLGRDGGSTIGVADIDLLVRSNSTARIQEAHQLLLHVLCEIFESHLV